MVIWPPQPGPGTHRRPLAQLRHRPHRPGYRSAGTVRRRRFLKDLRPCTAASGIPTMASRGRLWVGQPVPPQTRSRIEYPSIQRTAVTALLIALAIGLAAGPRWRLVHLTPCVVPPHRGGLPMIVFTTERRRHRPPPHPSNPTTRTESPRTPPTTRPAASPWYAGPARSSTRGSSATSSASPSTSHSP